MHCISDSDAYWVLLPRRPTTCSPTSTEMGRKNCHGGTHAVYPAHNTYGAHRDNIQPLQYQGDRRSIGRNNCVLCHVTGADIRSPHDFGDWQPPEETES